MGKHPLLLTNFQNTLIERYGSLSPIGKNWMFDYLTFQWAYWVNKNIKRRVQPGWVFGPKALRRWLDKTDNYLYHNKKFLLSIGMSKTEDLSDYTPDMRPDTTEADKMRHSGPQRLYHCLIMKNRFTYKSGACISCKEKVVCKSLK